MQYSIKRVPHYPSIKSPLLEPIAHDGKYRRLRRRGVYSAWDEADIVAGRPSIRI